LPQGDARTFIFFSGSPTPDFSSGGGGPRGGRGDVGGRGGPAGPLVKVWGGGGFGFPGGGGTTKTKKKQKPGPGCHSKQKGEGSRAGLGPSWPQKWGGAGFGKGRLRKGRAAEHRKANKIFLRCPGFFARGGGGGGLIAGAKIPEPGGRGGQWGGGLRRGTGFLFYLNVAGERGRDQKKKKTGGASGR